MDTTRTDHHPDAPSHPTPRARDLRERLDSAADEGLSQNISRFLRFLGHEDGDVIELQALGVPGKYGPIQQFTHVRSIEDAIGALEHEEGRGPVGSQICPPNRGNSRLSNRAEEPGDGALSGVF